MAETQKSRTWRDHAKSVAFWLEDRLSTRRRVFQRAARIGRIVMKERCNSLVACSGDLIDLPAACIAARWAKVPFFAYMFDDYASNSVVSFHREFSRNVMPWLMREAAGVVVPNEFLASAYRAHFGVIPWIIPNPVDISAHGVGPFRAMRDRARILYTGAVYDAHFDAFHRLMVALHSMRRKAPELHIYTSSGRRYLEQHRIGYPAIIHDAVALEESVRLQQDADILFLPLAFDSPIPDTVNTSAPGKMGELLASGRPVLVHAPKESFVSWYFRKHECGEVVDEKDPEKLRLALDRLRQDTDHTRRLVFRALERARLDFSLSVARKRLFDMLGVSI